MAFIRIPIPVKQTMITGTKRGALYCTCPLCGNAFFHIVELNRNAAVAGLSFANNDGKIQNAKALVTEELNANEQKMKKAINIDRDYSVIKDKVICSHCNEKQPWSKIPKPWKKVKLFWLWIFFVVFYLLAGVSLFVIRGGGLTNFISCLFSTVIIEGLLALFPVIHSIRRNKRLRVLENYPNIDVRYLDFNDIQLLQQLSSDKNSK